MNKVCFSHGQESGPWGMKIRAMADVARSSGWTADSLDYQGVQKPLDRVAMLVGYARDQDENLVLVGSSMGGFVATLAASQVGARGLFLLAPAFYLPGYEEHLPEPPACPTAIVHGWRDDIIPWQGSTRFGSDSGARVLLVDGDHRLTANIGVIRKFFSIFLDELREEESA
jgi:predicted alpha/beta-hydrolase family hydrolase